MATSMTLYNPVTGNERIVAAEIEVAYVNDDFSATPQFYVKMTTNGANTNGTVGPFYLTSLAAYPLDNGTKTTAGRPGSYGTLTDLMNDWTLFAMAGTTESGAHGGATVPAMTF